MCGDERLAGGMRRLARIGIDATFPLRCWQCETLYRPQAVDLHQVEEEAISFERLMAPYLCRRCTKGYVAIQQPLCLVCGRPFLTDHAVDHTCPDCLGQVMAYEAARAAGTFEEPLKSLIHHYKYQGRTELAHPFGQLLWHALVRSYDPLEFDVTIPVPLHWFRRYRRGFNQASLLLRDWHRHATDAGICRKHHRVLHHALVRGRRTTAQTGLGKAERAANLKGAFTVRSIEAVEGRRVLLVDDVLTTGATVVECARALMDSGAAVVKVLTLARAV